MRRKIRLAVALFLIGGPFAFGYYVTTEALRQLRMDHEREFNATMDSTHVRIVILEQKVNDQARQIKELEKSFELECMAKNIYFESGNQPFAGKLAVGNVVMNRVRSPRYPNDPCAVINQPSQFSWTKDGKSDTPDVFSKAWKDSQRAARDVLLEKATVLEPSVQYYHADYVTPSWSRNMEKVTVIGNHIFYRK